MTLAHGGSPCSEHCSPPCSSQSSSRPLVAVAPAAADDLDYRPPVDAPIVDHFRPPPRSGPQATAASTTRPSRARRCRSAEQGRRRVRGSGRRHAPRRRTPPRRPAHELLVPRVDRGRRGSDGPRGHARRRGGRLAALRGAVGRHVHRSRARAARRRVQRAPRARRRRDRGGASARRDGPRRHHGSAAHAGRRGLRHIGRVVVAVDGRSGRDHPPRGALLERDVGDRAPRRFRCCDVAVVSVTVELHRVGRRGDGDAPARRAITS